MSLINRMLQDLEARQDTAPGRAKPVYQDLRPVGTNRRRGAKRLLTVLLSAPVVVVAMYFGLEQAGFDFGQIPLVAALYPAGAPAGPTLAQPPRAVARAAPPPVSQASAGAEPEPEMSQMGAPGSNVVATAPPLPAVAEPAAAAVAPSGPGPENKAAVSIIKPREPPPSSPQTGERKPESRIQQRKSPPAATSSKGSTTVDIRVRPLAAEEKAEAAYRQAVRLFDQGRADHAIRELRKALAEDPKHVKARELAAGIALQTGHWREAQSLLEEGLQQVPNHYLYARLLARVYVDHGNEAKALAVMESAAPRGSDDAQFSALLGLLYQRAGRHVDAVEAYERALAVRSDDGRAWLGFAISLESIEKWDAAKDAYQRARENGLTPPLAQYAEQRLAALRDR